MKKLLFLRYDRIRRENPFKINRNDFYFYLELQNQLISEFGFIPNNEYDCYEILNPDKFLIFQLTYSQYIHRIMEIEK